MEAWTLLLPLLLAGAQARVCSVNNNVFEVEENTVPSEPLVDIYVPEGQQVTLGPSSTRFAFRIQGTQLFLNVTPDYEENTMLLADLECKTGDTVVTRLRVFVTVLDVNDNPPVFPFEVKVKRVPEDTKVNTTVISETELKAQDLDKNDILFYTLREVTPNAGNFFSLVGANRPALRLDRPLDFDRCQNMSLQLLVRDTRDEGGEHSHTATATLVLEVQPADLRPPWFLPCAYSDSRVCIQAQYLGAVPTGHTLPAPLILRPGPIYAVDGDRGLDQRIIYSILTGNEDGTFVIGADSGNLTMAGSVPRPKTFFLVVKGEQEDHARYSITQVTVRALNASGSPPRFPDTRYRGTVALGSAEGVAVQDAAVPSQPLRIQAQDPEFPDLNSAITYQVTNNSDFRMDGEAVRTAARLTRAGVFYAEVEANNTVTSVTTATVVEIEVSEQEPTPPGPPTPPETGRTTRPSSSSTPEPPRPPKPSQGPSTTSSGGGTGPHPPSGSSTTEVPRPPKPSQGPSTTSSGGGTGPHPPSGSSTTEVPRPPKPSQGPSTTSSGGSISPHPPSGTTVKPSASPMPGGPSSTSPPSASSSTSSAQTSKPGSPGAGGGTGEDGQPGGSHTGDQRFSVVEMAALGGVLGALLLLALIALVILVHKHYGPRLKCCSGKASEPQPCGFDNKAFLPDGHEATWAPAPSPSPSPTPDEVPPAPPLPAPPAPLAPLAPASPSPVPESPAAIRNEGGPVGVKSILTKERRPEGGYKAVWFGENIGAEAEVVIRNAPTLDADGPSDSGSGDEGSDEASDEGSDAGPGWGPHEDTSHTASTYI